MFLAAAKTFDQRVKRIAFKKCFEIYPDYFKAERSFTILKHSVLVFQQKTFMSQALRPHILIVLRKTHTFIKLSSSGL